MKKSDLLLGFLIGVIASCLGIYLFLTFATEYSFLEGIRLLKAQGSFGKLITVGALLNIIAFFILLKLNKDLMARGVVLATIVITIITLFV